MCNKNGGCTMSMIGKVLLIVGAINWGLVGVGMLLSSAGSWNVVEMIFGSGSTLTGIIYLLVGIAGVMKIFGCKCGKCMSCTCSPDGGMGMENKM